MRKQDHLLGLIKTLDANERGNFRKFANQQGDSEYLKLFDALDGKEQYNATELCRTLCTSPARLANQKKYLEKALLKSLRINKDGISTTSFLTNCVLEIGELIGRRQPDYAMEIVERGLSAAREAENSFMLPTLLQLKINIKLMTGDFRDILAIDQEMKALAIINEEHGELMTLMALVDEFARSRREPEAFLYHDHPMLHIDPEYLHSTRAKMSWFATMHQYNIAVKKDQAAIVVLAEKHVEMFDKNRELRTSFGSGYLHSWSWLVSSQLTAGNNDQAWAASEKLLEILPTTTNKITKTAYEFVRSARSRIAFNLAQYELSLSMSEELDAGKEPLSDYLRFDHIHNSVKGLLHNHRSAEAINKIEELLQSKTDSPKEQQLYLRPMMILAHLDVGNHKIVPYLIKSTRAWMKRQQISDVEIELLLSHTYTISKIPPSKRTNQWDKLIDTLAKGQMPKVDKELHLSRLLGEFTKKK